MSAMQRVPYVDFQAQFEEERDELMPLLESVLRRGDFVGGAAIEILEQELAEYCGVRYAVALNSGTDALLLGLKALGIQPGDEVITPPNSFVASTAAIVGVGATPVFADVLEDQNIDPQAVEAAITSRTRAIMPVHLTGRPADMPAIMAIAERHGLAVIEDAAQSIGTLIGGRMTGSFGQVGCFSAHPLKNLNAMGDAGFLTTNDARIAQEVRLVRCHGMQNRDTVVRWGTVSRMDTLQAEVLRLRLRHLPSVIERRRRNAELYGQVLDSRIFVPKGLPDAFNTYHLLVAQVDRRNELQAFLKERGVDTAVHYPVPIHLQPAAASLGKGRGSFPVCERQADRILSLPIHQFLSTGQIQYVAEQMKAFLDQ
jgi:dTDP-4-amino-4,6-dideoxygalactose transaminase